MAIVSGMTMMVLPTKAAHGQLVIEGSKGRFYALGSLGDVRSDKAYHMVAGLTGDGSMAVGQSELDGKAIAYVWSEKHGMVPLSESNSIAWAISGDGSMIVGRSEVLGGTYATSWKTRSGVPFTDDRKEWDGIIEEYAHDGAIDLGTGGHFGEFNAISPDGLVLAGQTDSTNGRHAFWIDGMEKNGNISFSAKLAARGDESAIYAVTDEIEFLRYAAAGTFGEEQEDGHCLTLKGTEAIACNTMQSFQTSGRSIDCALASLMGTIVSVGGSSTQESGGQYVPVLRKLERTSSDQIGAITTKLGSLPGGDQAGLANVISKYGGVVAGNASIGAYEKKEWRPFVWDTENGIRDLQEIMMTEYGIDMKGWDLRSATAISDDGITIGGWGYDPKGQPEPWIVTLE